MYRNLNPPFKLGYSNKDIKHMVQKIYILKDKISLSKTGEKKHDLSHCYKIQLMSQKQTKLRYNIE